MIKILIADDHPIVRRGIKQILLDTSDFFAIDEAQDGREVLSKISKEDYDIILLDLSMPGENGVEIIKHIRSIAPHQKILVLSMQPEKHYAMRALRAGASGYITKKSAPDDLVSAIRKVNNGGRYISASVGEMLAFRLDDDIKQSPHELLSDREFEVLCQIASGKTIAEIANDLSLSTKSVSTYRTRILEKMDMKTNVELANYVYQNKLFH